MSKYVQFGLILLVCLVLDQWTKQIASDNLASMHSSFEHPITLVVEEEDAGKTVEELLASEFQRNTTEEIAQMARRFVRSADGTGLRPDEEVTAGQEIQVVYRRVTVIPGYFDFEYTRNPGAAFGLLADTESPLRVPFFIAVSLIAVIVIILMLRGVDRSQQLTIWALSLIAGGAIGNFVDRMAYGWVIDFIVWKYTEEYRWPTFNVADAFITTGVALLVLDMILDGVRSRRGTKPAPAANADAVSEEE